MFHRRSPDRPRKVRQAWINGWAEGFEEHLPKGVGILVTGGATCLLLAFVHFALGVDLSLSWVIKSLP